MEYPLEKYKRFIEDTEVSLFERCEYTRIEHKSTRIKKSSSRVIAEIVRNGQDFSIRYVYGEFCKIYDIRGNWGSKISGNSRLIHRMRRINSRNLLTHKILEEVIKYQRRYLETGDPIDLAPFSQVRLTRSLNTYNLRALQKSQKVVILRAEPEESRRDNRFFATLRMTNKGFCNGLNLRLTTKVDISWVSRLVSRLSIITPFGEEKPLKWFFRTQRDINKRLIKQLFDPVRSKSPWATAAPLARTSNGVDNERKTDERRQRPKEVPSGAEGRTDREVKDLLKDKFGISVSRRTICCCRKELGIPPFRKRQLGDGYTAFAVNFSQHYPLTLGAVIKYASARSGVYELSVKSFLSLRLPANALWREGVRLRRTTKQSHTAFYIGSAKDIRKRLKGHLGQNKNGGIKKILKNCKCFFRYVLFQKDWRKEEKKLYELFAHTFGTGPKCNRVRPGGG